MELKKTVWKFLKPNETMCVAFGVFLVLAIIAASVMYRKPSKFNGEIRYENLSSDQKKVRDESLKDVSVGDDDKNVRYSERIREASSIGLGLSIFLVNERISKNRVMTLPEVMREFPASELLPPGVTAVLTANPPVAYGVLRTTSGAYYIYYSPKPLKIEILAASINGLADGGVFILRVPDTSAANLKLPLESNRKISSAGAWATLFEAPENSDHYIPPPFSPANAFTAINWQIRPLQQTEFSPNRMKELNDYLERQQ